MYTYIQDKSDKGRKYKPTRVTTHLRRTLPDSTPERTSFQTLDGSGYTPTAETSVEGDFVLWMSRFRYFQKSNS